MREDVMGESVNFVFLHGGGQGGWVWDETIAALAAQSGGPGADVKARCLALDGPGCGAKRGRDTSGMSFDEINAELVADIDAAGLTRVVLVGHSQAGIHLPRMAELRPELFAALVYVSCIAPDPGLSIIEMTGERIHGTAAGGKGHPFLDSSLSVEDRYRAMFCNDMTEAAAAAFVSKLGPDGWPPVCYGERDWRYGHLAAVPSSYVLCLADAILPLEWQERFATRFHARHVVRMDAGHQVMNTRPQALAEELLAQAEHLVRPNI
jgi:pimeloyl-ACP methyl ester carboxylesterase